MNTTITRIKAMDAKGFALTVGYESLRLNAYLDGAGVPTIGIGMTRYRNGKKVQMGDVITHDDAITDFRIELMAYQKWVDDLTRDDILQREFNALTDFCYHFGWASLRSSHLLQLVNSGHYTPEQITSEFLKWDKQHVNGVLVEAPGLLRRSKSDAWMFNYGEVNFFENAN